MIFETVQEWAQCREALLPAIEMTQGTHNEDDILAAILQGNMKLWRAGTSGVVTDVSVFPRMRCLNLFLIGGKMDEVMSLRPEIEKYAITQNCRRITGLAARKGWERFLIDGIVSGSYMYKDI